MTVGALPMAKSDTALFAHIAWRLEGKVTEELTEYGRQLEIRVGANAIRKALTTSDRLGRLASPGRVVLPWLRIDVAALDFFQAVVRLKTQGPDAAEVVGGVQGVVRVMSVEGSDDLLAIVIYERRSDRERLRARFSDIGEITSWEQIDLDTQNPAIATWRALAQSAAEREQLR